MFIIYKQKVFQLLHGFLLLMLMSGCEHPTLTEQNFGSSVRQMVSAQKYHQDQKPNPNPVDGLDGQQAEGVIKMYRESIAEPEDIQRAININIVE
jgi:hypothetical protein